MRRILIVALGIVLGQSPSPAVAQEKVARYVEKAGGFSWVTPKGWKMSDPVKETDAAMKNIRDMKKKIEAKKPAERTQADKIQLQVFDNMLMAGALAKVAGKKYQSAWGPEVPTPSGKIPQPSIMFDEWTKNIVLNAPKQKNTLADCVAYHKEPPPELTDDEKDSFMVEKERKLKTDAGLECAMVVTNYGSWRVTYYCFDLGKERILVATCSASWGITGQADKLDPVFDACIKTFKVEKP